MRPSSPSRKRPWPDAFLHDDGYPHTEAQGFDAFFEADVECFASYNEIQRPPSSSPSSDRSRALKVPKIIYSPHSQWSPFTTAKDETTSDYSPDAGTDDIGDDAIHWNSHNIKAEESTPATSCLTSPPDHVTPVIEVCYGSLADVLVSPLRTQNTTTHQDRSEKSWSLRLRSGVAFLIDGFDEVGQLDIHHSELLTRLKACAPSLRCEVRIVDTAEPSQLLKSSAICFNGLLTLYGTTPFGTIIGTELDKAGKFLQEPLHLHPKIPYKNPHLFTAHDGETSPLFNEKLDEKTKHFEAEIDDIINGSSSFDAVHAVEYTQDHRITSQLQSHQIEAVKFALAREADAHCSLAPTLWQRHDTPFAIQYKHILTYSSACQPQNDCRGGLLADDMGLGKTLTMLALIVHTLDEAQDYARTNAARENSRQPRASTLIVAPKSVIMTWESEIRRRLQPNALKFYLYHGQSKQNFKLEIKDVDIVLTTYETLAVSWASENNVLEEQSWFRVILDEAHRVKNKATRMFAAVNALEAQRRWCLTGTPLQNCLHDIFSLTKFLKFTPFATAKDIRTYIIGPLSRQEEQGLVNLRNMMRVCSLRRVKSALGLPSLSPREIDVTLSDAEQEQYHRIKTELVLNLEREAKKDLKKRSALLLQGINKFRRICCHGLNEKSQPEQVDLSCCEPMDMAANDCHSALENDFADVAMQNPPGHLTPKPCTKEQNLFRDDPPLISPVCDEEEDVSMPMENLGFLADTLDEEGPSNVSNSFISSKIRAVIDTINQTHQLASHKDRDSSKSIVFSSWKGALDCLGRCLKDSGIGFIRIDGDSSLEQRDRAITALEQEEDVAVMLLTLGTGAVGLNLTRATKVHLVEPHWNPMVEEQAISRAHRIGQTRPVTVYRYIVKESIEADIRRKQGQKLRLAQLAGVDGDGSTKQRQQDTSRKTEAESLGGLFEKWQLT